MKKGFTLVEIIVSICLLAMLSTVVITISMKSINGTKEKSLETMISSIENAAKQYVMDHKDEISNFEINDYTYVTLKELSKNEYFTSSLINPLTNEPLLESDEVYVIRNYNGRYIAKYDIDQSKKNIIKLNGSYNVYLKRNSTYIDAGVVDKNNNDITNSVNVVNNVDTSALGNYKVIYSYQGVEIERNVIVIE